MVSPTQRPNTGRSASFADSVAGAGLVLQGPVVVTTGEVSTGSVVFVDVPGVSVGPFNLGAVKNVEVHVLFTAKITGVDETEYFGINVDGVVTKMGFRQESPFNPAAERIEVVHLCLPIAALASGNHTIKLQYRSGTGNAVYVESNADGPSQIWVTSA